jgi:Rrf2 family protein
LHYLSIWLESNELEERITMKLLSEACEYGLRAVIWLAQRPEEPYKVKQIADEIRAAPGYLVKVLQDLTRAGILAARRGSNGGFTLIGDPSTLTALDVINAIDPLERITSCPLQLDAHQTHLCPIHRQIDDAMATIEDLFRRLTIQDVVANQGKLPGQCRILRPQLGLQTLSDAASSASSGQRT